MIEEYLRSERADRKAKAVLPSEVRVIDNLLKNSLIVQDAYAEILEKVPPGFWALHPVGEPWKQVINAIVSTAAYFSPERLGASREAVKRANEMSDDIARKASELASLLRKRSLYCDVNGIEHSDDFHPVDMLVDAAEHSECSHLFRSWVAPHLVEIREEFDLKYWPDSADFIDAIGRAQTAESRPCDHLTISALDTRQGNNPRDFMRALVARLNDLRDRYGIRTDFSHRTMAEIANCALDIPAERALTRESVKAMRSYQRRRGG